MPRPPRCLFANQCYHILNRANRKAEVFHDSSDYDAFLRLVGNAQRRIELPLIALCLMPNHVHFVVQPRDADAVTQWMHWLFTTHARHYHGKYGSTGHVWQGRYKHFPVQGDHHLLTLIRYVERNAARARLVANAQDWRWSSLNFRASGHAPLVLATSPAPLPASWIEFVNQPQTSSELEAIRDRAAQGPAQFARKWGLTPFRRA